MNCRFAVADIYDQRKIVDKYLEENTPNRIIIEKFPLPMFIVYGWGTSILVLFIEIFWHKFNLSTIFAELFGKFRRIITK